MPRTPTIQNNPCPTVTFKLDTKSREMLNLMLKARGQTMKDLMLSSLWANARRWSERPEGTDTPESRAATLALVQLLKDYDEQTLPKK